MLRAGMSRLRIFLMWLGLVAGSTVAGIVGHILLNDASPGAVVLLMGFAGGGVVAMLATTMMPEAFEGGGPAVAPATIVGFLASLLLSILEVQTG
ncbi:MAG: hypothetical protein AB7K36_24475, partial [Chloroflexota bacterium]